MKPKTIELKVNNGYNYYLIPKEDNYYWLLVEDGMALNYLQVTKDNNNRIIKISRFDIPILYFNQILDGRKISEIKSDKNGSRVKFE